MKMMKKIKVASLVLLVGLFVATGWTSAVFARTVEVDVFGMTCPFCVDSLQRKFNKMDHISKVDVSLKLKKVRLETEANAPDLEAIKKAVLDAGFTPTKVTVLDDTMDADAKPGEDKSADATDASKSINTEDRKGDEK